MNDLEIEERLRRLRPAGPPVQLRARIVSAAATARPKRTWPWIAAAAAALLMTATLQVAAGNLRGQARPAVTAAIDAEVELASALQTSLGVSVEEARMMAIVDGFRSRIEDARASQEGRDQ